MTSSTHKKNLSALVIGLIGVAITFVASTLSEGQFVCISKTNLLAIGALMGVVSRGVGEFVGRTRA